VCSFLMKTHNKTAKNLLYVYGVHTTLTKNVWRELKPSCSFTAHQLQFSVYICFWHYRSFYSSWTSFILVWHFFYCSLLDQILYTKQFFLCQYWKLYIICISTSLWSSSRIYPWSSTLHLIHHSSQYCHI